MTTRPSVIFATLAAIVALLAIVGGFMVIGSPDRIRKQQLDQIRSANLVALSHAVLAYRSHHADLPARLTDIARGNDINVALADPEGKAYAYRATGSFSYELCADFDLSSEDNAPGMLPRSVFTVHPAGHHCFQLEARPKTHD